VAVAHLSPITQRMRELLEATDYIDKVLAQGAGRAGDIAGPTMREVKERVGFLTL
jgi:tryptophanyl-tRNA synthetase